MQDWEQSGYWQGGDDPWDNPPASRRRKIHSKSPESHDSDPDHVIGSCDPTYNSRRRPRGTAAKKSKAVKKVDKAFLQNPRLIISMIIILIAIVIAPVMSLISKIDFANSGKDSSAVIVDLTPSDDDSAEVSGNDSFSVDIDPDGDTSKAETATGPSNMDRYTPDGSLTLELHSSEGLTALSYQEIYANVAPSVVNILSYQDNGGSYATGIILSSDGYILTNQHVVAACNSAQVITEDNETYEALLVGEDANSDLALLKIDAQDLTAAEFGFSNELVVGDECFAIGNPLSIRYRSTFSNGIISALERSVEVNGYSMTLLQTTAALNSGNSGGPLINIYGQVIGINNMKIMSSETTVEGLGFAIPSVTVQSVINTLAAEGEVTHPVIGITCYAITAQDTDGSTVDGIYVATVSPDSDAAAQGLQVNDIITSFDGQPVRDVSDIDLSQYHVGDTVTVLVWRDGETIEIIFRLSELNDLSY